MEAEVLPQEHSGVTPVSAGILPKISSEPPTPKETDPHLDRTVASRIVPPVEAATVTVQVFGVFSLPETWKTKVTRLQ